MKQREKENAIRVIEKDGERHTVRKIECEGEKIRLGKKEINIRENAIRTFI